MRWTPCRLAVANVIAALLWPVQLVVLPVQLAGSYLVDLKRWLVGPGREWATWWAWHPVETEDGERIWLERVERRVPWRWDAIAYRLPAGDGR